MEPPIIWYKKKTVARVMKIKIIGETFERGPPFPGVKLLFPKLSSN